TMGQMGQTRTVLKVPACVRHAFVEPVIALPVIILIFGATVGRPADSGGETFLREGFDLIRKGDLEGCIGRWQAAAKVYQQNHQTNRQIQVLVNLALAYQDLGQHRLAKRTAETAKDLADRSPDGVPASLKNVLGQVSVFDHRTEEAEERFLEA